MMTDYLTNQFAPYLSQAMGTLMTQAAQVMANQLAQQMSAQMAAVSGQIGSQLGNAISSQLQGQMAQLSSALENGFSVDADAFSNAIQFNMTQEDLTSLLTNFMNADELTYDGNMTKLGFGERSNPDSVSIYPKDFEAKEAVLGIVDKYNEDMKAADRDDATIQYSDIVGVLMSSVTDIVNTISLVLIAFVSISLVVSSIMISIITYISVLERKKEIGILRAMGASKLNVANIFNAETVIEGFFAGVLAVAVVYAASVPVNQIIYETRNVPNIMQLPVASALALVGISVVLTLVAGLIPSSAAARRDPVEALRSE
jgi:ABC-type antimicrobial peptide transport system permease subunit